MTRYSATHQVQHHRPDRAECQPMGGLPRRPADEIRAVRAGLAGRCRHTPRGRHHWPSLTPDWDPSLIAPRLSVGCRRGAVACGVWVFFFAAFCVFFFLERCGGGKCGGPGRQRPAARWSPASPLRRRARARACRTGGGEGGGVSEGGGREAPMPEGWRRGGPRAPGRGRARAAPLRGRRGARRIGTRRADDRNARQKKIKRCGAQQPRAGAPPAARGDAGKHPPQLSRRGASWRTPSGRGFRARFEAHVASTTSAGTRGVGRRSARPGLLALTAAPLAALYHRSGIPCTRCKPGPRPGSSEGCP